MVDNITVTIQAAGDSVMTANNVVGGTALDDDDCRKMYGLPHMFMASGYMKYPDGTRVGKSAGTDLNGDSVFYGTQFIINDSRAMTSGTLSDPAVKVTNATKSLRWDLIDAYSWGQWSDTWKSQIAFSADEYGISGGYGLGDSSITALESYLSAPFLVNRRPSTTAFTLRCESITHSVMDMSTLTALPGIDYGESGFTGTPEQLDNIAFSFGMKKETITLNGILIDRGNISADNPRRQVILNIARSQYLKIRNTSPIADAKDKTKNGFKPRGVHTQWGGIFAGPMNPRSYPCLTILGLGYEGANASVGGDVEADGGYRIYRGIIKSLSWTMDPGRPDFWRWKMTYEVVVNEKRAVAGIFDASDVSVGKDGEDTD